MGEVALDCFSKIGAYWSSSSPNESETKTILVDPLLRELKWMPLGLERSLPGRGRPDYVSPERCTAIETKRADPLYDSPEAKNVTKPYRNVLDQITSYFGDDIDCVIYTNGRFWWRVERELSSCTYRAVRFDLNQAANMFRATRRHEQILRFVNMFHGSAFVRENNFGLSVHRGQYKQIDGVGGMWVKDLNRGFGGQEHAPPE